MNLFNQDVTKETLIAECWCSIGNLADVQQALRKATVITFMFIEYHKSCCTTVKFCYNEHS